MRGGVDVPSVCRRVDVPSVCRRAASFCARAASALFLSYSPLVLASFCLENGKKSEQNEIT